MKSNIWLLACLSIFVASSCSDEDDKIPAAKMIKEWNIALSAKNENPAPAGRNETGTATMQLFSDNSLKYTINVSGLAATDALTAAHIHRGDVITNSGVVLDLNPIFAGGVASGTITNVRTSFFDSLVNDVNELYFNVHSTQVPSGLVRGQLNTRLEMVSDVVLNGANEVPAVTTTATGIALLRLTSQKTLYFRITVNGLETTDALTMAHIHRAAAGANAGVFIGLYASAAEFGTSKTAKVDDAQIASLKTDPMYVNVHSTSRPSGVIRGQIR